MRTALLVTAALLLATPTAAGAAEMPKELRGAYCLDTTATDADISTYLPWGDCTMRSGLSVTANGFDIVDDGDCAALKVKRLAKHVYRIRFRCQGEGIGEPLFIAHTWWIEKKVLKVTAMEKSK